VRYLDVVKIVIN